MNTPIHDTPGGGLNPSKREIADAVILVNTKYRIAKHILQHEQLTYEQVEEMLDGVRHLMYQLEDLKPRKK